MTKNITIEDLRNHKKKKTKFACLTAYDASLSRLMSEAGVGKSRLLYEFRKAVSNENVTFLEGKCLSYSRGVAYHPVIDILRSNFDVQEGDGDSEIREKVKRGLSILAADEASTLPYLLELLSVSDSGIDRIMMSPEGKKTELLRH